MSREEPTGRVYLDIPLNDEMTAVGLGANWDPDQNRWYAPPGSPLKTALSWQSSETGVDHAFR